MNTVKVKCEVGTQQDPVNVSLSSSPALTLQPHPRLQAGERGITDRYTWVFTPQMILTEL